jgi:hypothetical protein
VTPGTPRGGKGCKSASRGSSMDTDQHIAFDLLVVPDAFLPTATPPVVRTVACGCRLKRSLQVLISYSQVALGKLHA